MSETPTFSDEVTNDRRNRVARIGWREPPVCVQATPPFFTLSEYASQHMIEALPDRLLTEEEVDQLRESDRFDHIYIRGYDFTPTPGKIEELVITLADGTEKEIGYFYDTGWKELEPINPE